jgi:hypothetical protein
MSTRPLKTPKPYKMGGTENEIRYTYKISDQIRVVGDPKIIALWFRRQFTKKKKKRHVMSIDELYIIMPSVFCIRMDCCVNGDVIKFL